MERDMTKRNGRRRFWSVLSLVTLVIGGGFALFNREFAGGLLWALWVASVLNALANLLPERGGVAVVREDMSPTDLPPGAKIPLALMTEREREEKR